MARKILVADLLCGAGGSSTGAGRALRDLGLEMELVCVNHWPTAIETHRRNHPEARHYVQDIATVRPHLLVPEGYLDLLMASPTCTHHSVARGGKPTSDQQRSDPWHIITWLTELRVKRLIIENVWEFIGWGPVDMRTGKPIASRKGEYFNAWIDTIRRLGFKPEWRKLNAADYGDATTRQRFILMARSDGRRLVWPVATHRKRDTITSDLFAGGKPWRPARDIIDWSTKGRSIFNRPRPLAPKTLARILAGAIKFRWPAPFVVLLLEELDRSLVFHIRQAFSLRNVHRSAKERGKRRGLVRSLIAWLKRSRAELGNCAAPGRVADPMLVTLRRNGAGSDIAGPIPTIAANGNHIGLAQPVIVNMKGRSTASSAGEPLPTQTAHAPHLFSAEPIVLSQHSSGTPRSTDDPLPTITTGGAGAEERVGCARPMLVEPFVLSQASGGAPRSASDPLPTIVTGGQRGSGTALISPYYGSGSGETCSSSDEPLPTVTSKGRFGMVVPVTQSGGGAVARDVADPIPTLTTAKGGEFAIVMPVTHHDGSDRVRDAGTDPLPTVTGANRGELAFIAAQFGEREGQAPRVHDIAEPVPAICATGHVNFVEATEHYDILFRMLDAPELAAAMGFTDEDREYEFAGTKTEQIKQIGNAVSVAKMRACVREIMADAAKPRVAVPVALQAAELTVHGSNSASPSVPMLGHALALAGRGWPVFPANHAQKPDPFSKAPHLPKASAPGEKDGGHWLASADPDVIRGWWRRWPRALIGFPTGLRTQCVVVDLDPKDAPVEAMLAALTQFCGRLRYEDPDTGEIIEPAFAFTQSGGLHLYFAWPTEAEFAEMERNLARVGGIFKPTIGSPTDIFRRFLKAEEVGPELAHIDVRGEGGYVIAPPSVMVDGKAYSWAIPRGDTLPPLPRRLRGVITGEFLTEAERRSRRAGQAQQRRVSSTEINDRRVKAAVDAAIGRALDMARGAAPGNRNRGVYDAAVWLGRIVRGGFLSRSEAEGMLFANLPAGVPPTEPKIKHTISNGLDAPVPAFSPAELGPGRAA